MSELIEWLDQHGPAMAQPSKLSWTRGPLDPDSGVAAVYVVEGMDYSTNPALPEPMKNELMLVFQNGVVPEHGLNGVTPELLLEILIDRFEGYQAGPFACEENDAALTGMHDALEAIRRRRAERQQRGVLNTLQK